MNTVATNSFLLSSKDVAAAGPALLAFSFMTPAPQRYLNHLVSNLNSRCDNDNLDIHKRSNQARSAVEERGRAKVYVS